MSQIVTRKSAVGDDKEKRTDSPVKDMKKKVAANAEKEKQAEKPAEKPTEKPTDKTTDKPADKKEKLDKSIEKKSEKKDSKPEKPVEQKTDKPVEKKAEKKDEVQKPKDDSKGEKSDKVDKSEEKKTQSPKPKQNGQETQHNGTVQSNGNKENGTVSSDEEDQNDMLVIEEQDEMFPELAYDDSSDVECFEPPTPENVPSRSLTRRSQAKLTRTPETPRPASGKQDTQSSDDSKEPKDKVLKLKEDAQSSDRKLRSSDSPKPQEKKEEEKGDAKVQEKTDKADVEIVDLDAIEDGERRKTDTNYSKSRVKVSPYRRSLRLDNTMCSVAANYTGNNTTMETDITETSSFVEEDASLIDDSSYLSGLRQIRGRRSYKPLKETHIRRIAVNRSVPSASNVSLSEQGRPTVTVVGRKRKPDVDAEVEVGVDAALTSQSAYGKRARIFDRIAQPFRRTAAHTVPEIVGVNTDLPMTPAETIDRETLKPSVTSPPLIPANIPVQERERKCIVM